MIQAIKTKVIVGEGEKELSFEYDEIDNIMWIYLDGKNICSEDYDENFKQVFKKILEKWK